MGDLDQQLDALTDEEVVDALNRRTQRKAAAEDRNVRKAARRQASNDHMRAEVKRRFGKDLGGSGEETTADTDTEHAAGGRAEAARRFPKGI